MAVEMHVIVAAEIARHDVNVAGWVSERKTRDQ